MSDLEHSFSDDEVVPRFDNIEEDTGPDIAWQEVAGTPILDQLGKVNYLVRKATEFDLEAQDLIDAGISGDFGAVTTTIAAREKIVLSLGLQLVGFFAPELAEVADEMFRRFWQLNLEALESLTEEQKTQIEEVQRSLAIKQLVAGLGLSDEEAESALEEIKASLEAAEAAGVQVVLGDALGAFGEQKEPGEWALEPEEEAL